jgi:nucleoid DNA-binding protein
MATGTLTQAQLLNRTLEVMDDDLEIPKRNARDFIESMAASIEEALADGQKVSLFGLVTLTPKGVPAKPRRKGTDPRTGEEKTLDAKPATVRLTATAGKRLKDALPSATTKAGKALISEAKDRAAAAAARRDQREAEEREAAERSSQSKKSAGKKSAPKKR